MLISSTSGNPTVTNEGLAPSVQGTPSVDTPSTPTKQAWTPGPWRIGYQFVEHRKGSPNCQTTCGDAGRTPDSIRHDDDPQKFGSTELHGFFIDYVEDILSPDGQHVVCLGGHDYDDFGRIENLADAKLIAKAPELAEVLQNLVLSAGHADHQEDLSVERFLIEKAERILREAGAL